MSTIYLIRHSLRDFSVHDDVTAPLTTEGEQRAENLAEQLKLINFNQIFSSPYQRTIRTLEPLARQNNLKIQEIFDFREREVGCWLDDFWEFAEKQWADFSYKLENGESLQEVQMRNIKALQLILRDFPRQTIAIGTHGTALAAILNYYDKSFTFADFKALSDKMPYVVKLNFSGESYLSRTIIDL